jgi:hypothetical protein
MQRENINKPNTDISVLRDINRISQFLKDFKAILASAAKDTYVYASMDFEFDRDHKKKIHVLTLGQVMFTHIDSENQQLYSKVYLYDLRLFSKKQKKEYVQYLLLNPKVIKILHGSESLDLPAIRSTIGHDPDFQTFLTQMVDTRYLCEVHHLLIFKKTGQRFKRCTIYSALQNTRTITDDEYNKLASLKINYNKPWNIRKLSNKQIVYASSDVIFLYNLYKAYHVELGDETVRAVMDAYRYAVLTRIGRVNLPLKSSKTADLLVKLESSGVLSKQLSKSPMGHFTIGDLIQIDYLRKSAIRLAYDTYV